MAKSVTDQLFERDPLAFLRAHAISPQDFTSASANLLVNQSIYDQKPHTQRGGAAIDSTLTVQGHKPKIAFTTLEEIRDPQTGRVEHNAYKLFFRTWQEVGTAAGNYIACWFLPWASNHLTKIQIPPKLPARPGVSNVDPDIFFTAAITGCSVMVSGDPKAPIVAHGGTQDSRSSLSNDNAFDFGNARMHWTKLFQNELASKNQVGPIHGIHKDDYVNRAFTGTTREAALYEQFLSGNGAETMRVDSVRPEGAVFGLRDSGGNWSFYLQKKVRFTFTRLRKKKKLLKTKFVPAMVPSGRTVTRRDSKDNIVDVPEIIEDSKTVSVTIEVTKFFPGTGTVATAALAPAQVKAILERYL